jgi:O-antigen ligase
MTGFTWTAMIWGLALLALRRIPWLSIKLDREHIAIILLLLSTHSLSTTTADEILADPVTFERALRGVLVAVALLIVVPAILKRLRNGSQPGGKTIAALTIYVAVAAASFFYSAAPIVSLAKTFELAVALAVAMALAMREDAKDALRSALQLVVMLEGALIGVAVLGYFTMPSTFQLVGGRPGFLAGPTMRSPYAHFNHLSASSGMLFAYALSSILSVRDRSARIGWSVVGVVATAGMLLSAGRQGLVIFLAATAAVLFFQRRRLFLIAILPASALVIAANWDLLFGLARRGQSVANFQSWSGRFDWWSVALEVWEVHPWTGYGFGAGGRFVALRQIGSNVSSLHSGYIEALVGVGILGFLPLLYAIFRVGLWALASLRQRVDQTEAVLIVPLLLHAAVSLGFGAWLVADVLLFFLLAAMSDFRSRWSPPSPAPSLSAPARAERR